MQAVEISTFGAPDVLRLCERPKPVAAAVVEEDDDGESMTY